MERIQLYLQNNYVRGAGLAFAVRFGLALTDPNFSFGRAFGLVGFLVFFGLVVLSVVIAAVITHLILSRLSKWADNNWTIVALTVFISLAVQYPLLKSADSDWGLNDFLTQQQIEYFCLKNFHRDRCVSFVLRCPKCALEIDRWKRDLMNQKLKAHLNEFPQAPASSPRQPAGHGK